MKDTHPEAITVTLKGKKRTLKFGPSAFRYAAKRHGVEFDLDQLQSPNVAMFATLLWIGLLPNDPMLTEDDVLELLRKEDNEMAIVVPVLQGVKRMADGIKAVAEEVIQDEDEKAKK